ncbi:alpha-amylase family glycosyl hydrolase [Rhodoplanes sp. TEM]|uniref:1,4-alpha-glucan branching enzyme n=1 Tax=Rhodoplanes tepidamans TaxID=200616 RepID=A0ABT5JFL5_RHOTP|nr:MULTISPECIES: alpha-amylase family glycosyl hydrolase [Rhodoplanes]MDC7788499.1 alpha-amylase family glycosyl hydrolase [Rhodoplanes tepidamans]MDC7984153.1 alpha-amylase family glycosyl hydrolase [Rhodoplanes sp. TEM]MDQ0356867.1 1,4-alpha-glucan branching enzyme [Rhodoplanes tepidamans]
MPIPVHFEYRTGLRHIALADVRLAGSWDDAGRPSAQWSTRPMEPFDAEDGCPAFRATVQLDEAAVGQTLRWSVTTETAAGTISAMPTEVNDAGASDQHREFLLREADQVERYFLTHCRRLGANRLIRDGRDLVQFSVWAPNARSVELARASLSGAENEKGGYIFDDGRGVDSVTPMHRDGDGIWSTAPAELPEGGAFEAYDHTLYMFRVTKDDGDVAWRTDLFSRCQIGSGNVDPAHGPTWCGCRTSLDGTKSCSVVVDPSRVTAAFESCDFPETNWVYEEDFWRDEFDPARPVPRRLEDLVLYELHVDGLAAGRSPRGTLKDAMALLPYLRRLGVNAVELMPLAEYEGWASWGYGSSHYLAIEYAGGGRDQFKWFVRECHRHGIAVIMDVVYNHYIADAERAEWAYDSNAPETNIWYWYEGRASDYGRPDGGYVDNNSTGWAPRFWEENVRKLFVSSAAMLVDEFHVDGFRVDQTTSLHAYAVIHADGRPADRARAFGAKFLREWTRTMRLVRPDVVLIAEDHSGWPAVTQPTAAGGLGFDAAWYAEFYHQLIGDATNDTARARLLKFAGYGDDRPLAMSWFAGTLAASAQGHVVYHESHDEAGNSSYEENGREVYSARTIVTAVNGAPLIGTTRDFAEARTRVVAALALLGPGTPMFFMGEEVGAHEPYRYNDFIAHREDFEALAESDGARLFRFYQAVIALRLGAPALRSHALDVLHVHDANRVLAFRRAAAGQDFVVLASLANHAFAAGYRIQHPALADGSWREALNSDAAVFGGGGLVNAEPVTSAHGALTALLAANAVVVLERI